LTTKDVRKEKEHSKRQNIYQDKRGAIDDETTDETEILLIDCLAPFVVLSPERRDKVSRIRRKESRKR
jgi:hypothetical protein